MEINKKTCKYCLLPKTHIDAGQYLNTKQRKWMDESGCLWNGRVCPDCHRAKCARDLQAKRERLKNETKNTTND